MSSECLHLVSADEQSLVFEQLFPRTTEPASRLHLAISDSIQGLHRVPGGRGAPDLLLMHTRKTLKNGATDERLHFKRYNAEVQELEAVSSFSVHGRPYEAMLTVFKGAGFVGGAAVLALGQGRQLYFMDALHPEGVVSYDVTCEVPALHWVSEDTVAVYCTEYSEGAMRRRLELLRVERAAGHAAASFNIAKVGCVDLPGSRPLAGIGRVPSRTRSLVVCAILSDDTLCFYACKPRAVDLVCTQRLDVRGWRSGVCRRFQQFHAFSNRRWYALASRSRAQSYFLAGDGILLVVESSSRVTTCDVSCLPQPLELLGLDLGIFQVFTCPTRRCEFVRMRVRGGRALCEYAGRGSYQFDGARLLRYESDADFGPRFWLSFFFGDERERDDGARVCRIESTLVLQVLPVKGYPIAAPVTRAWMVHERLVVSTATQTATYEIDGQRLKRVRSAYDAACATVAAGAGLQVTRDAVFVHHGGDLSEIVFVSGIVSAAVNGRRVYVASVDTVHMVEDGRVAQSWAFDTVVVGVSCGGVVAVCTVDALHVIGEQQQVCRLQNVATSVACRGGRVYVGDVEGHVFIWPERRYVKVAPSPINCVRAHADGVTVLTGRGAGVFIDDEGRFVRLDAGGDVLVYERRRGFVLKDGVLHFVESEGTTMVPHMLGGGEPKGYRPSHVHVFGDYVYLFAQFERRLQRVALRGGESEYFALPDFRGYGEYHYCMLSETKFLEVCKQSLRMQDARTQDARFETHVSVRLYELGARARILDEKEFSRDLDAPVHMRGFGVKVKLLTANEFIIFDKGESAVLGSVEPREDPCALRIGANASALHLHDRHILRGSDGNVLVVDRAFGLVRRVSAQELRHGQRGESLGVLRPAITAVLAVPEAEPLQFVATDVSGVSLFKTWGAELAVVARARLRVTWPTLAPAPAGGRRRSEYTQALAPTAAIAGSRGAVYVVSRIRDAALARVLLAVQAVLRRSIEVIDSKAVAVVDGVDGGLLLTALRQPAAQLVFRSAGLNAAELRRALEDLVF